MPEHYEQSTGSHPTLDWGGLAERLAAARYYWLTTTGPAGKPHAVPLWGAWVRDVWYFDGIPTARWARDLAERPEVVMHLESAEDVLIVEGEAADVAVIPPEIGAEVVEQYTAKYPRGPIPDPSGGLFRLRPRRVKAWTVSRFPQDATVWEMGQG